MAEENLKTKGTEVEEETGFWNRLNIPLPERSTGLFRYIRDFFTCLEFLTRIRMTKREVWFPDDFARSVPYFPLVGGIMGALMWGAARVGALAGFSGNVLGVFLVLAELFFIGTLMYDGFMDTADGVFSGRTRERKLEIMQDSHVGANAVIGAIILILAKVTLLGSFPTAVLGPLLVAMYVVTRTLNGGLYSAVSQRTARRSGGNVQNRRQSGVFAAGACTGGGHSVLPWSGLVQAGGFQLRSLYGPCLLPEMESGRSDRRYLWLFNGMRNCNRFVFGLLFIQIINSISDRADDFFLEWNQTPDTVLLRVQDILFEEGNYAY